MQRSKARPKRSTAGIRKQELDLLCKDVKINAGGNYPPHIFVFRGGKYWEFDNIPKPGKPFGELVKGQKKAAEKWPNIHFPGGAAPLIPDKNPDKPHFVMVYKNKWSRWTPEGPQLQKDGDIVTTPLPGEEEPATGTEEALPAEGPSDLDQPKREPDNNVVDDPIENEELPDEPDGDPADTNAIFNDDPNPDSRTQVKGGTVCNLLFRENKLYRVSKCHPVGEDSHNYPPDIVAAIQPKDKNWYFISNIGKYCIRKDKNYEKVFK